jgi:hypothetical protein
MARAWCIAQRLVVAKQAAPSAATAAPHRWLRQVRSVFVVLSSTADGPPGCCRGRVCECCPAQCRVCCTSRIPVCLMTLLASCCPLGWCCGCYCRWTSSMRLRMCCWLPACLLACLPACLGLMLHVAKPLCLAADLACICRDCHAMRRWTRSMLLRMCCWVLACLV